MSSRSDLQNMQRNKENLKSIKQNNSLMHAHSNDRNKIYSTMKRLRNEPVKNMTNTLTTPVGTFYGEDVLEGFAADAEHLAKPNDEAGEKW